MGVKKPFFAFFALVVAGMWALGCSNSPTSSNEFMLNINIGVANTALAPTILEAQLLVDGATAVDFSPPAAGALATLNTSGSAGPGNHTLAVLILSQTATPTSYTVASPTIQVFNQNGSLLKTIQLPTQTAVLATGGSINYTFSL